MFPVPAILHEDDHLLVVNKPAGINTHAPARFAGEGLYDWLKHREPRWSGLSILHRLDKDTSGVIVFGKTALANRSLTEQFTARAVRKKYVLLTHRIPARRTLHVRSHLVRTGERYRSAEKGELAETSFRVLGRDTLRPEFTLIGAEPRTGRTHQIRVHAAESGFPILGDTLYGGTRYQRLCLHALELAFRHPADHRELKFFAPADFHADPSVALRLALIHPEETSAFRLVHGASDGWPNWYVDRLGDFLLSQSDALCSAGVSPAGCSTVPVPAADDLTRKDARPTEVTRNRESRATLRDRSLTAEQLGFLEKHQPHAGVYHKHLTRHVRGKAGEASPQLASGQPAPGRFAVRENGLQFELSFSEGYSTGLFLDQRDNRRRWLTGCIASGFALNDSAATPESGAALLNWEVLNTFAYTCSFSVCAAKSGARVTSLDLSKKYLDWGRRNFVLNQLDPAKHDFIYGDAFDWMRRLGKKGRTFDAIILDPPTFSQSKSSGVFRVERDFSKLIATALPLLRPGGILFASSNAAGWRPEDFLQTITRSIRDCGRRIVQQHYSPQPPDFPISRAEPGYLKTVWMRV